MELRIQTSIIEDPDNEDVKRWGGAVIRTVIIVGEKRYTEIFPYEKKISISPLEHILEYMKRRILSAFEKEDRKELEEELKHE